MFQGFQPVQLSFEGDVQVRTKSHLPKESRRDTGGPESARESVSTCTNTHQESATESASTRASARRDANVGVEVILTDRPAEGEREMQNRFKEH